MEYIIIAEDVIKVLLLLIIFFCITALTTVWVVRIAKKITLFLARRIVWFIKKVTTTINLKHSFFNQLRIRKSINY